MTDAIIEKLNTLLQKPIDEEMKVVYFMVEIRKLLEQRCLKKGFPYLTFYCDWVVHPRLSGPTAQEILSAFDKANHILKTGVGYRGLPRHLQNLMDELTEMHHLRTELGEFLLALGLPNVEEDSWPVFLHRYAGVVSDCPLQIRSDDRSSGIEKVTLAVDLANEAFDGHRLFRLTWEVKDRNGLTGAIETYASFLDS